MKSELCAGICNDAIKEFEDTARKITYNFIMNIAGQQIRSKGFTCDIAEAVAFSPVPFWRKFDVGKARFLHTQTEVEDHSIISVDEIMVQSFGVPQLWASTKPLKTRRGMEEQAFLDVLSFEQNSLMWKVYTELGLPFAAGARWPTYFFQGSAFVSRQRLRCKTSIAHVGVAQGLAPGPEHAVLAPDIEHDFVPDLFLAPDLFLVAKQLFGEGGRMNSQPSWLQYWDWLSFIATSRSAAVVMGPTAVEHVKMIFVVLFNMRKLLLEFHHDCIWPHHKVTPLWLMGKKYWHSCQYKEHGTTYRTNPLLAKSGLGLPLLTRVLACAVLFSAVALMGEVTEAEMYVLRRCLRKRCGSVEMVPVFDVLCVELMLRCELDRF